MDSPTKTKSLLVSLIGRLSHAPDAAFLNSHISEACPRSTNTIFDKAQKNRDSGDGSGNNNDNDGIVAFAVIIVILICLFLG